MRDWSLSGDMDCFDVIGKMFGADYNATLHKIAYDFHLSDKPVDLELVERRKELIKQSQSTGNSIIQVRTKPLTTGDKRYLKKFGIEPEIATLFRCYGVEKVWLNSRDIYYYRNDDPALAYYFGKDVDGRELWKIYFYTRKHRGRFLSNTTEINGWKQLPQSGETVIITKSMKDVMTLFALGYTAIAPQAETNILPRLVISTLRKQFGSLYCLYDFDLAGIHGAKRLRAYGIPYLFLTNGRFGTENYHAKDISDYVEAFGLEKAKELLAKWLQ